MKKARENILGNKVFKLALILFFVFLISAFLLVKEKISAVRAGEDDNAAGWAWSENFGWFSANCSNLGLCPDAGRIDYGLNVEDDGVVSGYLWSENIGWVRFENPTNEVAPDGSVAKATYDSVLGRLGGWAKILTLEDDGWLKLRGPDAGSPGGPFVACADCKDVEIPGDPPTVEYHCDICFTNKFPDPSETGTGNTCVQCKGCDEATNICAECALCDKYGVAVDQESGRLVGWAWNGNADLAVGVGWVNFSPSLGGIGLAAPWLETLYGEIYAREKVSSPSGFVELIQKYNATYCILTNGTIVNFRSEKPEPEGCEEQNFEILNFPETANLYTNIFGKIDLDGILAGEYGTVQTIMGDGDIPDLLGGKVYFKEGDLTIGAAKVFNNGANSLSGAGLIVIRGNLNINEPISYQVGGVNNLKNLASVGWLVLGDVNIGPAVEDAVGAFYVEGEVKTGTTGDRRTDVPLTIRGLMLAKKFTFERLWRSAERGSEQVIYDGRALANTPPGMADLVKALPVWREAAP